jgi:hypothetical protein
MSPHTSQKGFLMIVAAVLLVVIAFLAVVLSSLVAGNAISGATHLGSMQAFYQADSGLEFEQRRWAQNLDWYRSATDPNPNPATAQTLGTGSFTVNTNLPATLLKTGLFPVATTITAYTTSRFPAGGILQIEEDLTLGAEFVRYTGISSNTFTGVTRGVTVGTVASSATTHARSDTVYPVTTLVDALTASCTTPSSFRIAAHSKFLSAGTLNIEGEEIGYSGSTVTGGNMTLTGVTRCLDSVTPVTPAAHNSNQPVTPILINGDSANYQAEMLSTGTMGNNIRYARKTIQR